MATHHDGRRRSILIAGLCALAVMTSSLVAFADEQAEVASEKAFCRSILDEIAGQIQIYCDARQLNTLQCLDFRGTHGSLSTETLEKEWLESLKATGIRLQERDSTQVRGNILSQTNVILFQCTLTDNNGTELKTFRVRKTIGD